MKGSGEKKRKKKNVRFAESARITAPGKMTWVVD